MNQRDFYSKNTNNARWLLLFAISLMAFLINTDYTAVNLALITISQDFNSSLGAIQWILAAYVLAWAAVVIPAGKMTDIYGERRCCLSGVGLFILSSLLAGMANSTDMLIVARILQGIGAAIYIPTVYGLIVSFFEKKERGLAMGLISIGVASGMALGPTLGAGLLTWLGWRWIFYLSTQIGLIVFFTFVMTTRKCNFSKRQINFDKVGSSILSAALVLFIISLSNFRNIQFLTWKIFSLAISIFLMVIFVRWEKKHASPIIPSSLFKEKTYIATIVGIGLEQYIFSSFIVMFALYLQKLQHYSTLKSGIIFLAFSSIFGMISAFGGYWVDKRGIKKPTILGFILLAFGLFIFVLLAKKLLLWQLILMLLIVGIGMGLAFSAIRASLVKILNDKIIGIGSSLFLVCSLVGNTLGVIFTNLIFESTSFILLANHLKVGYRLPTNQFNLLNQTMEQLSNLHNKLSSLSHLIQYKFLENFSIIIHKSINATMLVSISVALFAAIMCNTLMQDDI